NLIEFSCSWAALPVETTVTGYPLSSKIEEKAGMSTRLLPIQRIFAFSDLLFTIVVASITIFPIM
ncbi:MAG: hypothetical protein U9O54_02415, partial [Chloroflexota bacterium]|nr:hypothetical protein [Chloroflexota bacterium]